MIIENHNGDIIQINEQLLFESLPVGKTHAKRVSTLTRELNESKKCTDSELTPLIVQTALYELMENGRFVGIINRFGVRHYYQCGNVAELVSTLNLLNEAEAYNGIYDFTYYATKTRDLVNDMLKHVRKLERDTQSFIDKLN